jgi:hypothetical protein
VKFSPIIFLFLFFCENLYSQIHSVDTSLHERLAAAKNEIYDKIRQAESQILANQNEFDILYYSLDLRPNPETDVLSGTVQVVAKVVAANLGNIDLNFWSGMNILDIHMTDNPNNQVYYTHTDDILFIVLDKTYNQNEEFSVTIGYNGQPQKSPYQSFDFGIKDGEPMIWTLSQPFGARAWWPCKDTPSDKADSVDIMVTVPNDLIVASNGSLRDITINGEETTYWWHEEYPIVTYLVSLAIHPYIVYYDNYLYNDNSDSMKIHFYMFPENYDQYSEINGQTKDMISFFADLFGQYPFIREKYAHADYLGGGAMEHQTCSSFGFWNPWVIVHELAHQWWGDLITCVDYSHIWLNEGFATYCESLWYENLHGPGTASYYQMTTNLYLGEGTVIVEDPENDIIFDPGLSYSKGSWILHMLRHVVGDDWIQNEQNAEVHLQIEQKQENHLFWMPVDVTITTNEGEFTFVVWDSLESQNFQFEVPSEPLSLEIDRDNWILKTVQEPLINPAFDRGILLVNGVNFDEYGGPIRAAYESKAFWGDFPISFWDCFNPPEEDYPSTLPYPQGHGRVPADVLGDFTTVIWIGNNFQGDINAWFQTSILPYLKTGGNLLLITRHGQEFIDEEMRDYLGIYWEENTTNTLANCVSDYSGLVNMTFTDVQSSNAVFNTTFLNDESVLLFKETTSFSEERALGVWKKPENGGAFRSMGGQFVFISARPYRFINHELRINSEYILEYFFGESKISRIDEQEIKFKPEIYALSQNYPNPFNPTTAIGYQLSAVSNVELSIYNLIGQKVATLVSEKQQPGMYNMEWNGSEFPSGIYYYRLKAGNFIQTKKMILLK